MRISDWSSDVCSSDLARSLATFPLRTAGADPDGAARVAIIDIGSNSIRLVVYQGPPRLPQVLFNEKVMAGLGRELASKGTIGADAMARARGALARFVAVVRTMDVSVLATVATHAVRDAHSGHKLRFHA